MIKVILQMKIYLISDFLINLKILITTKATGGVTVGKIIAPFKMVAYMMPISIVVGIQNWTIENSAYVSFVIVAIFIDWFLGSFKHWIWRKDFDWLENIKGFLVKSFLVLAVGFIFEGLNTLTGEYKNLINGLMMFLRISVFLYPAMSIIRSARVISDGKFPPKKIYDIIENWQDRIVNKK